MSSPPTTLGKYQIIREIARSNDIVYEAYDPLMNRRVALKELAMPGGSTPQQKEERINRFKREARAAGTLAHPNIMTVYELGEEGDRYFIAMEFLDGHSLRNELDTKGALGVERAVEIETALLRGLEYAHSKGVIHRDIKPDNIQLLSDGRIKITDFGIARLTFEPNLTMDGQVFGTPSYMSPEQVVGREIDARSDIFSAGVVLYEMIGGRKPFAGDSVVSITYSIMNKEPDRLSEANYALWQVIERSLDKSPALRFSSADEMIKGLESAQAAAMAGPVLDPQPYNTGTYPTYSTGHYGAVSQAANPYAPPVIQPGMQPGMAAPAPPPVIYPYNPYAAASAAPSYGQHVPSAQPGLHQPVMGQAYVPNPSGLPVYYPPPPRQPIFSPEVRAFWGKLFWAFLIVGTSVAALILVVNALAASFARSQEMERDHDRVAALSNQLPWLSPNDQVRRIEEIRPELKSPTGQEEAANLEAAVQKKQGEAYYAARDYADAEAAFTRAIELDPSDGQAYSDLSSVYEAIAADQAFAQRRMLLWAQSVQSMLSATRVERDPQRRGHYASQAAKVSIAYAQRQADVGDLSGALSSLDSVKDLVVPGSPTGIAFNRLLSRLKTP
jgi:serine/threonine-protein kinase